MTGIGPRLKKERLRLKLSQSALGAIGGVETNAQGNYENGVRSPVRIICPAFRMPEWMLPMWSPASALRVTSPLS